MEWVCSLARSGCVTRKTKSVTVPKIDSSSFISGVIASNCGLRRFGGLIKTIAHPPTNIPIARILSREVLPLIQSRLSDTLSVSSRQPLNVARFSRKANLASKTDIPTSLTSRDPVTEAQRILEGPDVVIRSESKTETSIAGFGPGQRQTNTARTSADTPTPGQILSPFHVWNSLGCLFIHEPLSQDSPSRNHLLDYSETVPFFQKMRSYVQFVTTPTADTAGTCLLLHFDNKRYLIGNAHEGIQRACMQDGLKLSKIWDIFLTGRAEWKNTGGMMGVILTLADTQQGIAASRLEKIREAKKKNLEQERQLSLQGFASKDEIKERDANSSKPNQTQLDGEPEKQTLTIHGGPNITHTLATGRRFIFRKGMPVDVNEIREDESNTQWTPTWADENIQVWAMSIEPLASEGIPVPSNPPATRKRSFDEFAGEAIDPTQPTDNSEQMPETVLDQEARDSQLRRAVISGMFNSDWHLDALVEDKLSNVKMPAALFVRDPVTKSIVKYDGPMPGEIELLPDISVLVRRPWPGALIADLPATKPSPTSLSYIIRNYPQRGKFNPEKAKSLGVPAGPLFAQLTAGKTVLSSTGKPVEPCQVLGPGKPGGGFAVVELPSADYIASLVSRPEWSVEAVMEGVEAIVWILGHEVAQNQALQKFMKDHKHLKHIVSSVDHCSNQLSLDSAASAAIRLNQVDPERFPIPFHNNRLKALPEASCIPAQRGLRIALEPAVVVQKQHIIPPLNTAEIVRDTPPDVLFLAKAIRQEIASTTVQNALADQNLPSPDAEIIALGTGSALPSKYRNVSATLLRVPGSGSYLFDCGENTIGQLSRIYSPSELKDLLQDLKMIWISHMHADHHLGTTSVIKSWCKANYGDDYYQPELQKVSPVKQPHGPDFQVLGEKRLFVASNHAMIQWLQEYSSVEDFGYNKLIPLSVRVALPGSPHSTILDWKGIQVGFDTLDPRLNQAMCTATGLTALAAVNVSHCRGAKAVALTFPTGFKFSYSGDCRPSKSFVKIGMDSTVLLHEATFDDSMWADAVAKKHSTISEAIGVGAQMRARRVLLTHFSQRYQKIPNLDAVDGTAFHQEGGIDQDSPFNKSSISSTTQIDSDEHQVNMSQMVEDDALSDEIFSAKPPQSTDVNPVQPNITKYDPVNPAVRAGMKIGVAFDYMRVKVKDIALLEKFTPALIKLYDHDEDLPDPVAKEKLLVSHISYDQDKLTSNSAVTPGGRQNPEKKKKTPWKAKSPESAEILQRQRQSK